MEQTSVVVGRLLYRVLRPVGIQLRLKRSILRLTSELSPIWPAPLRLTMLADDTMQAIIESHILRT